VTSPSIQSIALSPPQSAALKIERSEQIEGLYFIHRFTSDEEAREIMEKLDHHETPWHHSKFNGHCMSKVFGVRTQFGIPGEARCVRANKKELGELDIPEFLLPFQERFANFIAGLKDSPTVLRSFKPNECNANSYLSSEGHYLTPHYDDRALSGPVLMNLSLGCDSYMTYHSPDGSKVEVFLPKNTLQLVSGKSRFDFKHSISSTGVLGARRVSVTWRQAGINKNGLSQVVTGITKNHTTIDSS
jgi:alkylated DNA repair dioxygenase AlkB